MTQYAPHGPTATPRVGWYNYRFRADRLCCARGCPPGTHPLYIGKSNEPWARALEHAGDKSWFEHVTGWDIYPEVYATEAAALTAEEQRIRSERPVANIEHNKDNPCRLYFPPLGGGEPHPVRAQSRRRRTSSITPAGAPAQPRTVTRSSPRRHAGTWLALWAVPAALLPPVFILLGHVPPGEALIGGPVASTSLVVLLAAFRPSRAKRRR